MNLPNLTGITAWIGISIKINVFTSCYGHDFCIPLSARIAEGFYHLFYNVCLEGRHKTEPLKNVNYHYIGSLFIRHYSSESDLLFL